MRKNLRRIRANSSATRMLAGLALTLSLTAVAMAGDPPASKVQAGEIIVKVASSVSVDTLRQFADKAGCDYLRPLPYSPGYHLVRLKIYADPATRPVEPVELDDKTKTAVSSLKSSAGILIADPNYVRQLHFVRRPLVPVRPAPPQKTRATAPTSPVTLTPDDALYARQWALPMVRMPEAWAIQINKRSVVVGIADSGIDATHPDFNAADGSGSRILAAQNFVADANNAVDPNAYNDPIGHGTHVAGISAATTNNAIGVASIGGWGRASVDIKLKIARVAGSAGTLTEAAIVSGINWLVSQNVDVINMSFGGYASAAAEQDVMAKAIANNIVLVASLGNDNVNTTNLPTYPASYPGVIAVSAINFNRTKSSYSNYGGPVAIGAPGGDFDTSSQENFYNHQIWSTWPRTVTSEAGIIGYEAISGTSMAAPQVTGAVALLLAAGASHTPADVKKVLQDSALPLPDDTPNPNGNNKYGAGLLDVYSAILPYADPDFQIGFVGDIDLGQFYSSQFPGFTLQALGVTKAPAVGAVTIEIQGATIPISVVRPLVEGTDFTVPRTVGTNQPKSQIFTITAPANGGASLSLPPGRYKAVVKVGSTVVSNQFFEIISRTQPQGKALFSTPFKIRSVVSSEPEQSLFTADSVFTLARYNPLRLSSDSDYAIFQSSAGGRRDAAASFSVANTDGTPIVYEINDPTTSIAPVGLGYWLNINRPVTLNAIGPVATNSVGIKLYSANGGWNLIGAPFVQATSWGTAAVFYNGATYSLADAISQNIVSSALVGYSNGDYIYNIAPNGLLEPFQGYWVKAFKDCTLVIAPANTSRAVAPAVPLKTVSRSVTTTPRGGWQARLVASVSGDQDGQNFFGQSPVSSDTNDTLDVPKPPSGASHAYVRFLTPTTDGRSVPNAYDLRSLQTNSKVEWTAAVSTDRSNADVTMTWDGIGAAPRRSTLTLVDTATGQKVDMRSRSSYTFKANEAGTSRVFKIALAPTTSSGLLAINNVGVVGGGRSATQSGLAVRFSVTSEAEVTGAIKSLSGLKVGDMVGVNRAVAGGITTLRWDGRSRSGTALPPGPYMLEITARTADGQVATFKQTVQMMR